MPWFNFKTTWQKHLFLLMSIKKVKTGNTFVGFDLHLCSFTVCSCKTPLFRSCASLTLRPKIWLMAALSFNVHSAITFALISFMYSMKAFRGFLMTGFLGSFSRLVSTCCFLLEKKKKLSDSKSWGSARWGQTDGRTDGWRDGSELVTECGGNTYTYMPLSYWSCSCLPEWGTMAGWGIPVGCMPDGPSIREWGNLV